MPRCCEEEILLLTSIPIDQATKVQLSAICFHEIVRGTMLVVLEQHNEPFDFISKLFLFLHPHWGHKPPRVTMIVLNLLHTWHARGSGEALDTLGTWRTLLSHHSSGT